MPFALKGRVIRPAACSALHGFIHGRTPWLGEEFLDVAITQCEARIKPDRMLDDYRRKAVAAIGDFGHRASLTVASLPSHQLS
jgi:hypothetical protein